MYLANTRGIANLFRHKPLAVKSIAVQNIMGRLAFRLGFGLSEGYSQRPEQVTVVVTDVCNLRCKMCQYAYSDASGYQLNQVGKMDPTLYRKLMDDIPGRPMVSITGGEPLLHPQIADLITYTHSLGRPISLTTNGWLLERKAALLAEAGLDFLVVSVDGPPELHDQIRGQGSFERLSAGLETLLQIRQRPLVFISMALSDLNYTKLEQMVDLANDWGVDGLNFNHLWMQTDHTVDLYNLRFADMFPADAVAWEVDPACVDGERLAATLERIRRKNWGGSMIVMETPYLEREDIITWYSNPEKFVNWTDTRCAWVRMKVWPDGRVKPCRGWSAGNIKDQHTLEVWNGKRYREFRQLLSDNQTLPLCARCCYMAHR